MPAATVLGSLLLNKAASALLVGSCWFSGGAPGAGGRRLKLGGMISGALVTTANSSGACLVRPASRRRLSQADSVRASSTAPSTASRKKVLERIGPPLGRMRVLGLEHLINNRDGAQGNGDVGDVEYIPVIAEGVKVEKVRHPAINHPVNQIIPDRAADHQPHPDGQGLAGCVPEPPGQAR